MYIYLYLYLFVNEHVDIHKKIKIYRVVER